jgi:hypothetical protein
MNLLEGGSSARHLANVEVLPVQEPDLKIRPRFGLSCL